jgi:hypothetical protein
VNRSSHGLSFGSSVGSPVHGLIARVHRLEMLYWLKRRSRARPLSEEFPDMVAAVVAREIDGVEVCGCRVNERRVSGKALVASNQLCRVELWFSV